VAGLCDARVGDAAVCYGSVVMYFISYEKHANRTHRAGGDPGADIFSSPGDVWFWLHHAQIDRTWWIWQNQDPASRSPKGNNSLAGTITLNNSPPSRNTRLDDVIDLGVNAKSILIEDALSTTAGPFCYVYV
jgi:tyrosinase